MEFMDRKSLPGGRRAYWRWLDVRRKKPYPHTRMIGRNLYRINSDSKNSNHVFKY
jgi:hypothetical protein